MNKTHLRHSIASLLVLGFAAGCAVDTDEPAAVEAKVAQPSAEVFDYAPEGEVIEVPKDTTVLDAKGSWNSKFGSTYTQAVTIQPNQNVRFTTSGGTVGVDPVMVLFVRHDNSTNWQVAAEFTQRIGINTLAFNDDTAYPHSSINYTNNRGYTLNARLMVFAYRDSTGEVTLRNDVTGLTTTAQVAAGGWSQQPGTAGKAWTSNSGGGDTWLFTFSGTPGAGVTGDGFWNDDKAGYGDSEIQGVHQLPRWYVTHGFSTGTTTVNN